VKRAILLAFALLALSGCATILHGSTQAFKVVSDPSEAAISVYAISGFHGQGERQSDPLLLKAGTPASIVLERGRGFYREGAYRIVIEKQGFLSQTLILKGTVDPNILWNIIPPFIAGGWAIDAATGAMWTLSSADGETLQVKLVPEHAAATDVFPTKPPGPVPATASSGSSTPISLPVYGFEIVPENGHSWSGNYSFRGQGFRQTTPVNEQTERVIRYMDVSSWLLSVSISSGAVTVYEVVADDRQGKNGRRTGQSVSGNATDNPLIYLNHMEKNPQ
jgi:hypothetical protein